MTKREWIQALVALTVLWGLAALWVGGRLEAGLERSARSLIAERSEAGEGDRLGAVHVEFDGQWARLSGRVRSSSDARDLVEGIANEIRIEGIEHWNPVSKVLVADDFEVSSLPPGWLVAAAVGGAVEVVGVCASVAERDVLEQLLRSQWSFPEGHLVTRLQVDPRRFDDSAGLERTVRGLQMKAHRGLESVQFLQAVLGGALKLVDVNEANGRLMETALECGVGESEWRQRVLPGIERLRARLKEEEMWVAEQQVLAALPPAHVFLAIKGQQVLLRGEVYGDEEHRAVVAGVMAAYPAAQILDDLRARGQRRPGVFLNGKLPSIDSPQAKGLFLGQAGGDWIEVDWEVERHATPWKEALQPGLELELELLRPDSAVSIDWLQGGNAGIPRLALSLKQPFLTLCLYEGRVVLGGEVAQEGERAQAVAAARQAYPSGWVLMDQIAISAACSPVDSLIETVVNLPPAPSRGFLIAVARAGDPWETLGDPAQLADATALDRLAGEGKLSELSPSRVAEALRLPLEELRAFGLLAERGREERLK